MPPRTATAAAHARRTAFYARVTTDESLRTDLSLPNQRKRFHELAQQHLWVPREYVEAGVTSGQLPVEARPALAALMAVVEAGDVERVVARHLDRLGRGAVLEEIIKTLRARGVELWTFDGEQDIRSAAGRLGVRAQAMVGAFEVERAGERVREMKRQKARDGWYVGPTPYGYTSQARLIRELVAALGKGRRAEAEEQARAQIPQPGRLYIDEDEAQVVQEVFRLYVEENLGGRLVAWRLDDAGHRTRRGAHWSSQQVQKLIKDPKLAGWVTFDEEAYQAGVPSRLPIHKQARYEAKHDAIVDRDLWERAQHSRRHGRAMKGKPTGRVYALKGVVRCCHGHPAKARFGGRKKGHAWYTCRRRCIHGPDPAKGGCDAPPVRVEDAEGAVLEVLTQLLSDPAHLHEYLVAGQRKAAKGRAEQPERLSRVRAELRALDSQRQRYYRLLEATEPGSDKEQVALDRVVELKLSSDTRN